MTPQGNMPAFMGVTGHTDHPGNHPTASMPALAAHMTSLPGGLPGSSHPPGAGLDMGGGNPYLRAQVSAVTPHDPFQPEGDRRNSSIAALRLKAREHSVAMGILSAYGK